MKNSYLNLLEEHYKKHADPDKAAPMKQYMKNKFEFLGISSVPRKEIYREFFRVNGKPEPGETEPLVRELWAQPEREYQYFGMTLMQKMEKKFGMEILSLQEFMIITGSWWDTVDFIAANLVGPLLLRNKEKIHPVIEKWMESGNIWLERTALLFQLKFKKETDKELLFSLCKKLSGREEFFIRKAIGWALREYSKIERESVSGFVRVTPLSSLSEKEALRIIKKI